MYSKNKNAGALRSQARLSEALLELMEERPYSEISITDITTHANVVRKTFYRNFECKDDILDFIIDYSLSLYNHNFSIENGLYKTFMRLYDFLLSYKKYFLLLYQNNLYHFVKNKLAQFIEESEYLESLRKELNKSRYSAYLVASLASIVCSVVETWAQNGFKETPEELSQLTDRLISGLFEKK